MKESKKILIMLALSIMTSYLAATLYFSDNTLLEYIIYGIIVVSSIMVNNYIYYLYKIRLDKENKGNKCK